MLLPLGDRVAYELGLKDVAPYGSMEKRATRAQLGTLVRAMRNAHAHKLFLPSELTVPAFTQELEAMGFAPAGRGASVQLWSDARSG